MGATKGIYPPDEPEPMSVSECQSFANCMFNRDPTMSEEELDLVGTPMGHFRLAANTSGPCYPPRWAAFHNSFVDFLESMVENHPAADE